MRTATVANLRNEFPKVFAWIEAGEEIAITRRGRIVANGTPAELMAQAPSGRLDDFFRSITRSDTEKNEAGVAA